MTARHQDNPTPDQARLRMVVVVMLVVLFVGVLFFRDDDSGGPGETVPVVEDVETTSTTGTATLMVRTA